MPRLPRSIRNRLIGALLAPVAVTAIVPLLSARSAETVGSSDQVWIVRGDGGELRKLNPIEKWQQDLSWSPNGKRIAFTAAKKPPED